MNASKTILLTLTSFLLLATPLLAGAFPQNGGGGGMGGGGMAGGPSMQGVAGKVVESMNSGGYTYVLVDQNGAKTWVALPQTDITVGSEIACQPGMAMQNFTSSSLNRTFESIVFSSGLATAGNGAAAAPAPAAAPVVTTPVGKAEGAEGRTIGEIFAQKQSLANTQVAVQAKVVKVSRGILGKNWLHLQDGTGNPAFGTNDLVVTTDALPEVGEVVTIRGNLALDRDFGSGYRYGVIVEDAAVSGK